jgi:hypothetical protein
MQQKQRSPRSPLRTRAISLLLAAVLILGLVPGFTGEASAHWADGYLNQLVEWGFIRPDQANSPDGELTRADFMAITNRAYGYDDVGETPFTDVAVTDWFYDDVGIAYNARYINGTSPTTASPNDPLNRETAATILGRNMMLQESAGEILDFTDARDISSWARGTVKSSLEHYLVGGYDDGTFKPQKDLSWGEMAAMLSRIVGTPLQEAGDYSLGGVFGNVTISADGVTLRDTVISGDLYVTGGVGLGGVKLENVTVLGRIIASGTGESEGGQASILLRNVTADELLVDNLQDHYVTLKADGITEIGNTTVRTSAYIEDNTPDGMGLKYISLEGTPDPETGEYPPIQLDLAGRIEEVVNRTPNSQVRAAKGTVKKMTIDEAATDSTVIIDRNTVVKELNLDVGTNVIGEGDIEKLVVNAPGCTVEMLPDQIEIRPGITAVIDGVEMDSTAAEESSMEPLILAGYPQAQDIAPNSITAVFSTNKRGTVYWAVSPITDGSVEADDLIKPPAYGSIAVSNGSVLSPKGNEEVSSAVAGLTAGGNYYLSAVLVDDRGHRSPTKVISFTTPDNTVPDFAKGYPYMSKVSKTDSMVVVMPTKSCKLYYALLPEGAVAPTPDELKTGAVVGSLGYGVRDVTKNTEDTFRVNDVVLEEQTTYVLYLWLVDANGANSSKVVSLTFKTDDETPPTFIVDPTVNKVQATSVGLTFRLDEDGTVYWVAVPAGTPYPKPEPGTDGDTAPLDSKYAILQVVSGMNIGNDGKAGKVTAKANADGTITVSGLKPESAYDFYYVAKDNAGPDRNYSAGGVKKITIHTLDNSGPKVSQTFTKFSGTDNTQDPTSDTDIVLTFSEDVRYTGSGGGKAFSDLWKDYQDGNPDKKTALKKLAENLYGSIRLHKVNPSDGSVEDVAYNLDPDAAFESKQTIDYTKATITRNSNGTVDVTFPSEGLHLENGGQYYFTINNLTDTSDNQNPIVPSTGVDFMTNKAGSLAGGHNVPVFTVEPATIIFTKPGVAGSEGPYKRNGSTITTTLDRIDMSFRMRPNSTKTVSANISYDLLFFTDITCAYDLYYRVIDSEGNIAPADSETKYTSSNGFERHTGYPGDNTPDDNGWIYLGNSGDVRPEEKQWRGRSLSKFYNKCDSTNFPRLTTLDEDLRYEFVITMTKIDQLEEPKYWNDTVHFEVNAAADQSNELDGMVGTNGSPTKATWTEFKGKAGSGIARSIGRWTNPETKTQQDTLELSKAFSDSRLPEFANNAPSFSNITSTTADMFLTLKTPGTVYYAIGRAENSTGVPEIPTYREKGSDDDSNPNKKPVSNSDYFYIAKDKDGRYEPPVNGSVPMPWWMKGGTTGASYTGNDDPEKENKIIRPLKDAIFDPASSEDLSNVITGSFKSTGLKAEPVTVKDLLPDTTYYLYCVIKGEADTLSHVYIYQFTTEQTSKPKLNLRDQGNGSVNMWTDIASNTIYRVYTQSDARQISFLTQPFIDVLDKEGKFVTGDKKDLPTCYQKKTGTGGHETTFTVLDALTTTYGYSDVLGSANKDTAFYPTNRNGSTAPFEGGFSVFDIYASENARMLLDNLIRTGVGSDKMWIDYGTGTTKGSNAITNQKLNNISLGTQYVILAAAQSTKRADTDTNVDYLLDSFKAFDPVQQSDPQPPNLRDAVMSDPLKKSTTGDGYDGSVILSFDKPLYVVGSDGKLVPVDSETFQQHLIKSDNTTVNVSPAGGGSGSNVTSFRLDFKNLAPGTSIRIDGGLYQNVSGEIAQEPLTITLVQDKETTYIKVEWGIKGSHPDYLERSPLGQILNNGSSGGETDYYLTFTGMGTVDGATGITIDGTASKSVTAALMGGEGTVTNVVWTSENTKIATVGNSTSLSGTVTGVGIGTTTVKVSAIVQTASGEFKPVTASFRVVVKGALNDIKFTKTSNATDAAKTSITKNGDGTWDVKWERKGNPAETFSLDLTPANAGAQISWEIKTGSPTIINASGSMTNPTLTVQAMGNGVAVVSVTIGSGANAITGTINVEVTGSEGVLPPVTPGNP